MVFLLHTIKVIQPLKAQILVNANSFVFALK